MAELADLLVAVDEGALGTSGAFWTEDNHGTLRGSVLVEDRRVCWATTLDSPNRLRYLLRQHAERSLMDADLDDALAACRSTPRLLSELLIERGILSDDGLRAALRQHTIESLIAQCGEEGCVVRWVPHRRHGYGARHRFPSAELLASAGALLYPGEYARADLSLLDDVSASVAGAFAIGDDGHAVVVEAALEDDRHPLRDLLWLGDWAVAALSACDGFSAALLRHAMAAAENVVALGWRGARRLVHAAMIEPTVHLTGLVTELSARQIPAVISVHVPRPTPYASRLIVQSSRP